MGVPRPWHRHRLRCQRPVCGKMFSTGDRSQKYCTTSCAMRSRTKEWWDAHQLKCIATRKARGYSRFIKRMRVAGLTDEQINAVRKEILSVRAASHTAGKRKGWAEALKEGAEPPLRVKKTKAA